MQDKVCIITGGASGMGYATAKLFASEGAKLVLADINEEQGEKVAEEIRAGGTECIFQKCNVALEADTKALADVAVKTFGRIDSLISFAGLGANPIAFKKLVKDYEGGSDEKAEEIAGPALFLANDEEASFVTGVNLCVDGGWNCL